MNDYFKIHTKINPEYNNRIMLVHNGENQIEDKTQIVSITKEEELKYARENHMLLRHLYYFKEYLEHHYKDDASLQRYKEKAGERDTLIFLLVLLQKDIVFIDITSPKDKKRSAIMSIPSEIDDTQMEEIQSNSDYFKNFDSIIVLGELFLNEYSMPDNKFESFISDGDTNKLLEILNRYKKEKNKTI